MFIFLSGLSPSRGRLHNQTAMTQTPEESAMAIAESASQITTFLQERHPTLGKPEAMRATALLIDLMADWVKSSPRLHQQIAEILEEIANEGN